MNDPAVLLTTLLEGLADGVTAVLAEQFTWTLHKVTKCNNHCTGDPKRADNRMTLMTIYCPRRWG